jgi:hypothetical protein
MSIRPTLRSGKQSNAISTQRFMGTLYRRSLSGNTAAGRIMAGHFEQNVAKEAKGVKAKTAAPASRLCYLCFLLFSCLLRIEC